MAISAEVASLAVSVVTGALRLGKRLDEIQAEETALRAAVPLAFPEVKLEPSDTALRTALGKLLKSTAGIAPDPLGADRQEIERLRQQSGVRDELLAMCRKHGLLETIATRTFRPDAAFREALRARSAAWELDEAAVRDYTFFVAAGPDLRGNSLGFRIGAAVLDVLAEVAAQNTRFVISHEPTRRLVETVLVRFSEPDLAAMSGWGEVLRGALRATLNTVVDEREALAGSREWIERALSAVAHARDVAPNGDDFVLGLLRGRGFDSLLRGVLLEGADYLSEGDAEVWEEILSDVLVRASAKAEGAAGFEDFFAEHWHSLVGAGLASLQEHGPRLLDEDDAILKTTLVAAVGALADAFDAGPPDAGTLGAVIEAAVGVFADPGVLEPAVREPWLRDLIASVAGVVRDDGLRASFSQPALERYARGALEVFSRYPELIADDSELVQEVLSGVLGKMATAETFGVGPLADAAVEGALDAIAANPGLLKFDYPSALGQLAAGLAERVANGGIAGLQAEAIVAEVADVLATNEELFLAARAGLADAVVDAILDAAAEDPKGVLAGAAVVAAVRRVLAVVAARGKLLPADLAAVEARVKELAAAGLAEASKLLGRRLAQDEVPAALSDLFERMAKGETIPDPGTPEFRKLFGDIADDVTGRAA
jgi:hypothetical protein